MVNARGLVTEGRRLVWRNQRALWWLFAANLLLAAMGAEPLAFKLAKITDRSLASQRLSQGFDLTTLIELLNNPGVSLGSHALNSLFYNVIFFVFTIFVTGGILESFRSTRKLTTAQFFEASGYYFWRWVRQMLLFAVVMASVLAIGGGINSWADTLSSDAAPEKLGFWVMLGGAGFTLLLSMIARLWFDMAQTRTVATDERSVVRSVARAFGLTFSNFRTLFFMYFRISLVGWTALLLGLWVWIRLIPASHFMLSFLVLELTLLAWLATRLWQRAGESAWYQRYEAANPPLVPVRMDAPLVYPLSAEEPTVTLAANESASPEPTLPPPPDPQPS
jgi:hypothetical protein